VAQFDAPTRLIRKPGGAFAALAKSILYQQLAGTAAAAIHARFLAACGAEDDAALRPTAVLAVAEATLRGCGISSAKACYLRDLAAHFADGRLSDEVLLNASSSTAQLHTMLTAVKGIGPWSVTMFEMFFLGNTDILPVGDLGVRKARHAHSDAPVCVRCVVALHPHPASTL
jgi:DNA-3-methyladenine glycosylase II